MASRSPRTGIRPTFRLYADDVMAAEIVRQTAELWQRFGVDQRRVRAAQSAARRMERWKLGQGVKSRIPPPKL